MNQTDFKFNLDVSGFTEGLKNIQSAIEDNLTLPIRNAKGQLEFIDDEIATLERSLKLFNTNQASIVNVQKELSNLDAINHGVNTIYAMINEQNASNEKFTPFNFKNTIASLKEAEKVIGEVRSRITLNDPNNTAAFTQINSLLASIRGESMRLTQKSLLGIDPQRDLENLNALDARIKDLKAEFANTKFSYEGGKLSLGDLKALGQEIVELEQARNEIISFMRARSEAAQTTPQIRVMVDVSEVGNAVSKMMLLRETIESSRIQSGILSPIASMPQLTTIDEAVAEYRRLSETLNKPMGEAAIGSIVTLRDEVAALKNILEHINPEINAGSFDTFNKKLQEASEKLQLAESRMATTPRGFNNIKTASGQASMAILNFNYVVRDSPYFFQNFAMGLMAIGNNINPLIDNFLYLKKAAKEANESMGSSLASALKGGAGISLAFSLAVTAIQSFVFWQSKQKDETKKATDSIYDQVAALRDLIDAQNDSAGTYRQAQKRAEDANKSYNDQLIKTKEDRKKILENLEKDVSAIGGHIVYLYGKATTPQEKENVLENFVKTLKPGGSGAWVAIRKDLESLKGMNYSIKNLYQERDDMVRNQKNREGVINPLISNIVFNSPDTDKSLNVAKKTADQLKPEVDRVLNEVNRYKLGLYELRTYASDATHKASQNGLSPNERNALLNSATILNEVISRVENGNKDRKDKKPKQYLSYDEWLADLIGIKDITTDNKYINKIEQLAKQYRDKVEKIKSLSPSEQGKARAKATEFYNTDLMPSAFKEMESWIDKTVVDFGNSTQGKLSSGIDKAADQIEKAVGPMEEAKALLLKTIAGNDNQADIDARNGLIAKIDAHTAKLRTSLEKYKEVLRGQAKEDLFNFREKFNSQVDYIIPGFRIPSQEEAFGKANSEYLSLKKELAKAYKDAANPGEDISSNPKYIEDMNKLEDRYARAKKKISKDKQKYAKEDWEALKREDYGYQILEDSAQSLASTTIDAFTGMKMSIDEVVKSLAVMILKMTVANLISNTLAGLFTGTSTSSSIPSFTGAVPALPRGGVSGMINTGYGIALAGSATQNQTIGVTLGGGIKVNRNNFVLELNKAQAAYGRLT